MSDITIIGGITADIEGHPYERLVYADSNPGKIAVAYGGVGRNIAENLGRLGVSVSFHSVAGDDHIGRGAVRELSDLGVDVSGVRLLPGENTAMYMSILNIVGDMELALCNMDALEKISPDMIDQAVKSANDSKIIALDTNLAEETLAYAADSFSDKPLFLDPVSSAKAERAKKIIGKFHIVKPNRAEAEILTDIEIRDPQALEDAGRCLFEAGVKQVFITLSAGGVYYKDEKISGIIKPDKGLSGDGSATGAGDAFSAAVLYSYINGYDLLKTAAYGMAASQIAMESKTAVNPMMSVTELTGRIK